MVLIGCCHVQTLMAKHNFHAKLDCTGQLIHQLVRRAGVFIVVEDMVV